MFPAALIPIAVSAITALVRFRDRVDDILSLNRATEGLPFALPPAPPNVMEHKAGMLAFFDTDAGKMLVELRGLQADLVKIKANFGAEPNFGPRQRLFELYCQAAEIRSTKAGPPGQDPSLGAQGPSTEMRLAWFIVDSHRLSRNPALTRVLLAAADTLLEFGAQNAGLFMKDSRLRGAVETLLTEFAVKRDWDDASSEQIFRTLLGSAAAALAQHGAELSDAPALAALFGALADVRDKMGDPFVENFISRQGFTQLAGFFLTRAANTPGLLPGEEAIRPILAAVLQSAGEHFDQILDDPKALLGVLESGLAVAATQAESLVNRKLGSRPLLAGVLVKLADQVKQSAGEHTLFADLAHGDFIARLYDTTLTAVAARPDLLATEAGLSPFVASLVGSVAKGLAEAGLEKAFSTATLQNLGVHILDTLAQEPDLLAGHNDFISHVLGAVLPAAAKAAEDGLSTEDLIEITEAALGAVGGNLGLVEMDDHLRAILEAVAQTLNDAGLKRLLTDTGRKEVFLKTLDAVVANPRVWRGFAEKDLVAPLVQQVFRGLATDPTRLLTGPAMVETARLLLLTLARQGRQIIEGAATPKAIGDLLAAALTHADAAIGTSIDGETLPEFLQRALDAFLRSPIDLGNGVALTALLTQVLPLPESSLLLDAIATRSVRPIPKPPRRRGANR